MPVVGLATDASRFFKFLLIIVEFSIAMVLFVRLSFPIHSIAGRRPKLTRERTSSSRAYSGMAVLPSSSARSATCSS